MALLLHCGSAGADPPVQPRQPALIPPGKTLAIADAIALALKNQPLIRQSAAQVNVQAGVVTQAESRRLPNVTANASVPLATAHRNTGATVQSAVNQLLLDFGRSRTQLTQAEQQEAANVYGFRATTANVVLNAKTAYYTLLRSTHLVGVFEQNVKAQDQHVAQTQARLNAGLAPKADVLKAQASAASARVDLINAQNDENVARVNLNIAMGVDVRSAPAIVDTTEPETPVPSIDEGVVLAVRNRPEMCQALQQLAAAESGVRVARTGNLPAFTTSLGDIENVGGFGGTTNSFAWLLNMQWTPFDAGFTRGAITQAQGQVIIAAEAVYATQQSVTQDVATSRYTLLAAQESLQSALAEVASATESLAVATGRYEAGIAIFIEVTDAQSALLKAQVDQAIARYAISIARATLEHAIGAAITAGGMALPAAGAPATVVRPTDTIGAPPPAPEAPAPPPGTPAEGTRK